MQGLGSTLVGFCRALVAYAAVGGAVGEAIAYSPSDERVCWPQHAILWIYSSCESGALDALWFAVVGLPRFLIVLPAIAARSVYIASRHVTDPWIVVDKGVFIVADPSVLMATGWAVAAIFLAGLVAWAARARVAALLLGSALVGQIASIAIYP